MINNLHPPRALSSPSSAWWKWLRTTHRYCHQESGRFCEWRWWCCHGRRQWCTSTARWAFIWNVRQCRAHSHSYPALRSDLCDARRQSCNQINTWIKTARTFCSWMRACVCRLSVCAWLCSQAATHISCIRYHLVFRLIRCDGNEQNDQIVRNEPIYASEQMVSSAVFYCEHAIPINDNQHEYCVVWMQSVTDNEGDGEVKRRCDGRELSLLSSKLALTKEAEPSRLINLIIHMPFKGLRTLERKHRQRKSDAK